MSNELNSGMKHEPDTTSVPLMTSAGLGLLFLVLSAVAAAALVFRFVLTDQHLISADQKASEQRLTPGVQPNQAFERQQLQIQQRQVLNEFYWQNEERGLASIPIEQAITIMAQRKLRTDWPMVDPTAGLPAATETATETKPEGTAPKETKPEVAQPGEARSKDAQPNRTRPIDPQPTEQP